MHSKTNTDRRTHTDAMILGEFDSAQRRALNDLRRYGGFGGCADPTALRTLHAAGLLSLTHYRNTARYALTKKGARIAAKLAV